MAPRLVRGPLHRTPPSPPFPSPPSPPPSTTHTPRGRASTARRHPAKRKTGRAHRACALHTTPPCPCEEVGHTALPIARVCPSGDFRPNPSGLGVPASSGWARQRATFPRYACAPAPPPPPLYPVPCSAGMRGGCALPRGGGGATPHSAGVPPRVPRPTAPPSRWRAVVRPGATRAAGKGRSHEQRRRSLASNPGRVSARDMRAADVPAGTADERNTRLACRVGRRSGHSTPVGPGTRVGPFPRGCAVVSRAEGSARHDTRRRSLPPSHAARPIGRAGARSLVCHLRGHVPLAGHHSHEPGDPKGETKHVHSTPSQARVG